MFGIGGISDILANPTYAGKIRFNYMIDWSNKRRAGKNDNYVLSEGVHEAIISEEVGNKSKEIRIVRESKYSRTYSREFPLTGLLRCPVCGCAMVASRTSNTLKDGTKNKVRYYSCGLFKNKVTAAYNFNCVRAEEAEKYVFDSIQEVMLNEKILKDIVKNLNKAKVEVVKPLESERKSLDKQISHYMDRKKRIFELYEYGDVSKEALSED